MQHLDGTMVSLTGLQTSSSRRRARKATLQALSGIVALSTVVAHSDDTTSKGFEFDSEDPEDSWDGKDCECAEMI